MVKPSTSVFPCSDLQTTLEFFVEHLGFRLDVISPADDPRRALVSGHGLSIELRRQLARPSAPSTPHDTREIVVSRGGDTSAWVTGRAGMRYRDLIPGRLGGRFIASLIRIDEAGPVPDSVHFHDIRFQMIYCVAGWVRVAYENQGPPLLMQPGDCFLQPPGIRHRVLECSAGLEVIEIACPAEHDTLMDHEMELPTGRRHPGRDFDGQRFVHHVEGSATWSPGEETAFEVRDTGLGGATGGLASARVWRVAGALSARGQENLWTHGGEFLFLFLLAGTMTLHRPAGGPLSFRTGDSAMVPAGFEVNAQRCSADLHVLEVRLPGAPS